MNEPKVLVLDIETSHMTANIWNTGDQYIRHGQITKDFHLMSWGAKWLKRPASEFIYASQQSVKPLEDDKKILLKLRNLLDEADIIVTQNGVRFDWPKIKARLMLNDIPFPSHFQHVDVYKELKGVGFTSHSLEYLTNKFCKKYRKLSHSKFPGESLWTECTKGNSKAWDEMRKYNRHDVLSLEELLLTTLKWLPKVSHKITTPVFACSVCGSKSFWLNGIRTVKGRSYRRQYCKHCGAMNKHDITNID